jgi:uncharacterized LabA/DUF88 family protein
MTDELKAPRVAIIVDGFNLYHSAKDAIDAGAPNKIKWLDIKALLLKKCFGAFEPGSVVGSFDYFTSLQPLKDPGVNSRHKAFIRALQNSSAQPSYGNFVEKPVKCKAFKGCAKDFKIMVEKRTDVAIAARMLEIAFLKEAERILLVSGDTDLVPAIQMIKKRSGIPVTVAMPYNRRNRELEPVCKPVFLLTIDDYKNHLFPERIAVPGKSDIVMPTEWK